MIPVSITAPLHFPLKSTIKKFVLTPTFIHWKQYHLIRRVFFTVSCTVLCRAPSLEWMWCSSNCPCICFGSYLSGELLVTLLPFSAIKQVLTLRKSKKDVIWKWVCYIYVPAYYPPSTSSWTSQCFWPLFLCHISLPVALPRFSPFYPLLLYHSLTFSNAFNISAPLVFCFV